MVFSSTIFIFLLLPFSISIYFLIPNLLKNYWLLLVSLIFYAWGEPNFVIIMIAVIIVNYLMAIMISKFRKYSKTILIINITLNIGLLFIYKYLNFTTENLRTIIGDSIHVTSIALPIGISFFIFQAMSYVIDIYRGSVDVQKNPCYLALYISFFPQLIAGPIVRYSTIEEQIINRRVNLISFSDGIRRFVIGLGKKVLIANQLAVIADTAFSALSGTDGLSVSLA